MNQLSEAERKDEEAERKLDQTFQLTLSGHEIEQLLSALNTSELRWFKQARIARRRHDEFGVKVWDDARLMDSRLWSKIYNVIKEIRQ